MLFSQINLKLLQIKAKTKNKHETLANKCITFDNRENFLKLTRNFRDITRYLQK